MAVNPGVTDRDFGRPVPHSSLHGCKSMRAGFRPRCGGDGSRAGEGGQVPRPGHVHEQGRTSHHRPHGTTRVRHRVFAGRYPPGMLPR